MLKHAFIIAAVIAAPHVTGAQAKRPMRVDDLLGAIRVGDPQLSPDGRTVAYVRTTTDITTGKRNSDIWMVPADGSAAPRAWIESPRSDDTPRFLPNGNLVFISSRDGTPQVYVASGKEVHAVTKVGAGVQGPLVVSPDGAAGGVRCRRGSRVCGRGVQRARPRFHREGSGEGSPAHAAALPPLE